MPNIRTTVAGVVGLFALLALIGLLSHIGGARATDDGNTPDAMSIDMDTTGNSATTLGALDQCTRIDQGSSGTIDVTVTNVPPYVDNPPLGVTDASDMGGIISFSYEFQFPVGVTVNATPDHSFLLNVNSGSSVFNASDGTPDSSSPWTGTALDTGNPSAPEEGSGVLTRLTLAVSAGMVSGQYMLSLTNLGVGGADGNFYIPHIIEIANIAVGQACGALITPTPTPTPTATPLPATATPTRTPSPTPSPMLTPPPPLANDNFSSAKVITSLPYSDSLNTAAATQEPGEPQPCGSLGRTVWYSYTPTVNGTLEVYLSSNFDSLLVVYSGTSLGDLALIDCSYYPVNFFSQAGETYYFQVGAFGSESGSLTFNVEGFPSPANDEFASATAINSIPYTDTLSNEFATTEPGERRPCYGISRTLWYTFTPSVDGVLQADTKGSLFGSVLAVYRGSSLSDLTLVDCSAYDGDDELYYYGKIRFLAHAGEQIYFQVGGYYGDYGNLVFNLIDASPPPNDDFENAAVIPGVPFTATQSTATATRQSDEPDCTYESATVWYSFTPAADMHVQVDTFGSNYDTVLSAYTGSTLLNLERRSCNDNASGIQSRLVMNLKAGITYYFKVGADYGDGGNLVLNLAEVPRPVCPASPTFQFVVTDPPSDSFFGYGEGPIKHEVTRVTGKGDAGLFCLKVAFADAVDPADASTVRRLLGTVDFDTDSNPSTGPDSPGDYYCPVPVGIGVEARLNLNSLSGGFARLYLFDLDFSRVVEVDFDDTAFTVFIPMDMLGGDSAFDIAMIMATSREFTDCVPNGGAIELPYPDADSDFAPDRFDNCVSVPNTDQTDSDVDGKGDVCDPTPIHDLEVVSLNAQGVTISGDGTAVLRTHVTVKNLQSHPDLFRMEVEIQGLPFACEVTAVSGNTGAVRALGKETFQVRTYLFCRTGLLPQGTYPLTVLGRVIHGGAPSVENHMSNNWTTTTATLRAR